MHYEQDINNIVLHNDYDNLLQPPMINMLWEIHMCHCQHIFAFANLTYIAILKWSLINPLSTFYQECSIFNLYLHNYFLLYSYKNTNALLRSTIMH
jgi:hypothetical protein